MHWKEYKLEGWRNFAIKNRIVYPNMDILLLDVDYLDNPPIEGRKNLIAIEKNGEIQWIADIPHSYPMYGFYQDIRLKDELLEAWCGSIYCIIDPLTGKILSEEFVR